MEAMTGVTEGYARPEGEITYYAKDDSTTFGVSNSELMLKCLSGAPVAVRKTNVPGMACGLYRITEMRVQEGSSYGMAGPGAITVTFRWYGPLSDDAPGE